MCDSQARWVVYLKCLIEAFHHADPLGCLLSKLTSLHLQCLHLMVQLTLVDVGLGHPGLTARTHARTQTHKYKYSVRQRQTESMLHEMNHLSKKIHHRKANVLIKVYSHIKRHSTRQQYTFLCITSRTEDEYFKPWQSSKILNKTWSHFTEACDLI